MVPRALLVLAGALAWLAGCDGGRAPRPNIVLVVADDLAAGALGFEGNAVARTPNLDRLAREGARFARAYVPTPQCAPSRAALLLGVAPHASGALANRSAWDTSRTTLAEALRDAGYRCGFVGKWHLGDDERPQAGFEESWRALDRRQLAYVDPVLWVDGKEERRSGYLPSILTDEALAFLDADDERPFFLWLAHLSPHEPLTPPPDPALAHDPATLPLPESRTDDLAAKPALQRESEGRQLYLRHGEDGVRRVLATYQSMVDALDREVGRLLAGLEERGHGRDTLVVFLSDNGTLRGEHGMVTKGPCFYEELVRTPLVVSWPGTVAPGTRAGLASSLDLFPTLAEIGGASVPDDLAGSDLAPMLADPEARVHERVFLEYARKQPDDPPTPMLGWVDERAKYVRYLATGEEELYDLGLDPHELVNLAADASTSTARIAEARAALEPFRAAAEDALRR